MQTTQRPLGQRVISGFTRLLITVFVIGLIGLVAYLASERNARTYSFALEGGNLVVMKGKMFPTGAEPWKPSDAALADAYAPIPLEGLTLEGPFVTQTFADRDELDRALFTVLERQARPRIAADDPKEVDKAATYVRRMQKLPGITQEQRATLDRMQAELAWYLARLKLDQARQILSEALNQLDIAATGQNRNAQRANSLAAQIAQPAREFEETLRRALSGLPAPLRTDDAGGSDSGPANDAAGTPERPEPSAPAPSPGSPAPATPAPSGGGDVEKAPSAPVTAE